MSKLNVSSSMLSSAFTTHRAGNSSPAGKLASAQVVRATPMPQDRIRNARFDSSFFTPPVMGRLPRAPLDIGGSINTVYASPGGGWVCGTKPAPKPPTCDTAKKSPGIFDMMYRFPRCY